MVLHRQGLLLIRTASGWVVVVSSNRTVGIKKNKVYLHYPQEKNIKNGPGDPLSTDMVGHGWTWHGWVDGKIGVKKGCSPASFSMSLPWMMTDIKLFFFFFFESTKQTHARGALFWRQKEKKSEKEHVARSGAVC